MAKPKITVRDPSTPVEYVQFGPHVRRIMNDPVAGSSMTDQALLLYLLEQGDETNRLLAEVVHRLENMLWLK
jgi:hypothetical protein